MPKSGARAGGVAVRRPDGVDEVERELPFEVHQRVAHRVEASRLELGVGLRLHQSARRDPLRARAEQICGEHVELRRLVDRSRPCPAGTGGRPRRSGCPDTSSPRCTGRRRGASARRRAAGTACCRIACSRSRTLSLESVSRRPCSSDVGLAQQREQLVDPLGIGCPRERPGTARSAAAASTDLSFERRVEDVVEPALRLGEALRLAQMHRDRQRDVKEQLPVVVGVRPARRGRRSPCRRRRRPESGRRSCGW